VVLCCTLCWLAAWPRAVAGDAPQWMQAVVSTPLPAHDEKDGRGVLYSESTSTLSLPRRSKTQVRKAYKILRPVRPRLRAGHRLFNSHKKITGLRGWCIPAQGKDYEIKG